MADKQMQEEVRKMEQALKELEAILSPMDVERPTALTRGHPLLGEMGILVEEEDGMLGLSRFRFDYGLNKVV